MSGLSQFTGGARSPKLIVNRLAVAGWTAASGVGNTSDAAVGAKNVLSGALIANTLANVISITGGGSLRYLSASSVDATSRTIRVVITVDGTVIYDYTSAAIAAANSGGVIVSGAASTTPVETDIQFKTSLLVQVASSLGETNLVQIGNKYHTY